MNLWKERIITKKDFAKECAEWMVQRLEALTSHMQYEHTLIAYRKQDDSFRYGIMNYTPFSPHEAGVSRNLQVSPLSCLM